MSKYVYSFGAGQTEGKSSMRDLLGGKGANLAEMANLGIPVPPGFTITTEVCTIYLEKNEYPDSILKEIKDAVLKLEKATGKKLGDKKDPLLVSVRSGARISMPGMMDTVLNLGLNDESVIGLSEKTGNSRFAYDCYRRFISMFGDVVLGIEFNKFEHILDAQKTKSKISSDTELSVDDLKAIVEESKKIVLKEKGFAFPQEPEKQLFMAIDAVFDSWNTERAVIYRRINNIPNNWGTAVNVQSMVYGNMGETSGTGVAFTRNPSTGENRFFGEYLINAQGEDVVAGIRTPSEISTLEKCIPVAYKQLVDICKKLEKHFKDMQDIEFTIQEGQLFMLQTRNGKRTAPAATKIAVDMVNEGLIDKRTAVTRITPSQIDQLLHPMIDPKAPQKVVAKGLPASPGAAVGKVVFTSEDAEHWVEKGERVILVRTETSPEDIGGMHVSEGVLTVRGGMTSHAAVVGRGMGKPCVVGCGDLLISAEAKNFKIGDIEIKELDFITIDGSTGCVILGQVPLIEPEISPEIEVLLKWADGIRTLGVRTNADNPADAQKALELGAEGIGLCRTEHMFFEEDRIAAVRAMIMSETKEEREIHLKKILPMQKEDFKQIFKVMRGKPVTIRYLDPPLHEFLPKVHEIQDKIRELQAEGAPQKEIDKLMSVINRVINLHELNPMLGHRGCRLGITYPEIYNMQTRAIIEAACELSKEGIIVKPELMIPLVGHVRELEITKKDVQETAAEVMKEYNVQIDYTVGTMIELPRAVMTADQIAKEAEFFSFGTNDLTQTTFGFSRDDVAKFIPLYIEDGILADDPFAVLDREGVGELMKIGIEKGRKTHPGLKMGICGEHGGEPNSIIFANELGLNYVSCSPYRVPIARLVAAQATIAKEK
ncbi:pyruvate, phosphate dikinase [Methanolapillus millepedarum]|uniref:pyruvate, phosphate dikinase n=1 Tax=Methanolapillus millepedarum TaxID=3028296 RepID=A0AA96VD11_9EURY|nr:Pyruvate, phosphate dikinase [Methanosarcinaceae archaeon Ac7]